jgi:hypothetical protein
LNLLEVTHVRKALHKRYKYVPLNNPKDIRVVRVQRYPTATIPLACTLQTANAAHIRVFDAYEAVSYVWGPADLSINLLVDGDSHLKISKRLHDVLLELVGFYTRLRTIEGGAIPPIWIDASCIDQHNDAERSSQAQQMAEIY